jgi:Zn-dependent M32 family carboxypeptidase
MLHLCEQAKRSSGDEITSGAHHILSADEVDLVLGQDASPERRTEAMAELSARRYELVTRARARDYLKELISQGINIRKKVSSGEEIAGGC